MFSWKNDRVIVKGAFLETGTSEQSSNKDQAQNS